MRLVQGQMGPVVADRSSRTDRGDGEGWRRGERAFDAMMGMRKIDVAKIEAAVRGEQ